MRIVTRLPLAAVPFALLISAPLVLVACGSSVATGGGLSSEGVHVSSGPATHISFRSPAIARGTIPALYTCDGKNIFPPLEWGRVPAGSGELVLLVIGLTPSHKSSGYRVSVEWAIGGVSPQLHRLAAGRLPRGAFTGLASDGNDKYSVCPEKGVREQYQFMLYATPARVRISPRFRGLTIFAALAKPGTQTSATGAGAFVASYERR